MRLFLKVLLATAVALLTIPFANATVIISIDDRTESLFLDVNGVLVIAQETGTFGGPATIMVTASGIPCPNCLGMDVRFIVLEAGTTGNVASDIIPLMVSAGTAPGTVDLSLTFTSDALQSGHEALLTYVPNPTLDEIIPEFGTFQTIYSGGSGDNTLVISFASDPAPEPATLALLGLGLAGLGFSRRRKRS